MGPTPAPPVVPCRPGPRCPPASPSTWLGALIPARAPAWHRRPYRSWGTWLGCYRPGKGPSEDRRAGAIHRWARLQSQGLVGHTVPLSSSWSQESRCRTACSPGSQASPRADAAGLGRSARLVANWPWADAESPGPPVLINCANLISSHQSLWKVLLQGPREQPLLSKERPTSALSPTRPGAAVCLPLLRGAAAVNIKAVFPGDGREQGVWRPAWPSVRCGPGGAGAGPDPGVCPGATAMAQAPGRAPRGAGVLWAAGQAGHSDGDPAAGQPHVHYLFAAPHTLGQKAPCWAQGGGQRELSPACPGPQLALRPKGPADPGAGQAR